VLDFGHLADSFPAVVTRRRCSSSRPIMFDRCTDSAGRVPDLHQAEVEYIRSRMISGRPGDELTDEFRQLCAWTRQVLDGCGVNAARDNLSKLTWLRQAAPTARRSSRYPVGEPQVVKLVPYGLSLASWPRRVLHGYAGPSCAIAGGVAGAGIAGQEVR
jgi:hypothetical protein